MFANRLFICLFPAHVFHFGGAKRLEHLPHGTRHNTSHPSAYYPEMYIDIFCCPESFMEKTHTSTHAHTHTHPHTHTKKKKKSTGNCIKSQIIPSNNNSLLSPSIGSVMLAFRGKLLEAEMKKKAKNNSRQIWTEKMRQQVTELLVRGLPWQPWQLHDFTVCAIWPPWKTC